MKKLLMLLVALFMCAGTALAYDPQIGPETVDEQYAQTAIICAYIYEGLAHSGTFPYQKYIKLMKANVSYAFRFVGAETTQEISDSIGPIISSKFGGNYENADAVALQYSYECQKSSSLMSQVLQRAGK